MKKPVIGISLDSVVDGGKYQYSIKPWYALRRCYSNLISKHGGIPMMLPLHTHFEDYINIIDGLLIPGGDEDIHPKFYGEAITRQEIKTNDDRANFELGLTKLALDKNLPVFGICNGLQVINTVFGGTLFQHLPDVVKSDINHEQPHPKDAATHLIHIEPNSILSSCTTKQKVMVNSTHHQAVNKVGTDLKVTARAPDGVIEAIESTKHNFVIGVEWHPEYQNSELDENLFKEFIKVSSI